MNAGDGGIRRGDVSEHNRIWEAASIPPYNFEASRKTTSEGYATVVLEKEGSTLVYKRVPARICNNCGEEYISSEINRTLLQHARKEADRGVTLEMMNFAA